MYRKSFRSNPSRFSHARTHARSRHTVRARHTGQYIDPKKFINKAVITEEVEHFVPEHNFDDFKIDDRLKKSVAHKGYVKPTAIQDRSIGHILQGADLFGIANTGTGKTATFLIPLIHKVLTDRKQNVLIIAPTRELAMQIEEELRAFTRGMSIFSVCCVGGSNIGPQIRALRYQNNFVIGTPGRLKDLIDQGKIKLEIFGTLVLDEADRMLDMGFIADIRSIVAGLPKIRQTLFFSATISSDIERLIGEFLKSPVRISVKTRETAKSVDQDIVKIDKGVNKFDVLKALLAQKELSKVLVFGRTKHGVERISRFLIEAGLKATSIHGNKSHSQRQHALKQFKNDTLQILVATDVAARGLDIPDVSHVINFDIPATYDDYVHRIGRTGRAGKGGKALTFVE